MSGDKKVNELRSELKKELAVLTRVEDYLVEFEKKRIANSKPGIDEAMSDDIGTSFE